MWGKWLLVCGTGPKGLPSCMHLPCINLNSLWSNYENNHWLHTHMLLLSATGYQIYSWYNIVNIQHNSCPICSLRLNKKIYLINLGPNGYKLRF